MEPFELLQKATGVFECLRIQYLVTGAIASNACGEPRLTNDIDMVAAGEENYISDILKAFPMPEFYLNGEAVRDTIRHQGQFNNINISFGVKIDVMIKKGTPFDRSQFNLIRKIQPAESYQANFASHEYVIIKKMEYYKGGSSEKHLRDIKGIMEVSKGIGFMPRPNRNPGGYSEKVTREILRILFLCNW